MASCSELEHLDSHLGLCLKLDPHLPLRSYLQQELLAAADGVLRHAKTVQGNANRRPVPCPLPQVPCRG